MYALLKSEEFKMCDLACPVSKESIRLFLQQRRAERGPPPSIDEIRQRIGWGSQEGEMLAGASGPGGELAGQRRAGG